MKKIDWARYLPVGLEPKLIKDFIRGGFWGSLVFLLLSYSVSLADARAMLFWKNGTEKTIRPGAVMQDFVYVLGDSLIAFVIMSIVILGFCLYHYLYHRQGSRSIYLMRRIPDKWELHRRCLTVPILAAVFYLVCAFLCFWICFAVYLQVTPAECLVPGQLERVLMVWF